MAVKRAWTNPAVYGLDGPDNRTLRIIFESLTGFLSSHIGVWGEFNGTTDANGDFVITHDAGFLPAAVLITEKDVGDETKLGPYHIDSKTDTTVTVHFLDKSGNDRAAHTVGGYYHVLPATRVRD